MNGLKYNAFLNFENKHKHLLTQYFQNATTMTTNTRIEWTQMVKCCCEPNFHKLSRWIAHFYGTHIKTTDGKNFECRFCDQRHSIIAIMTHMLEKHADIAYFCNNCEEEFYTLEALKLHQRCDCDVCGFARCICLNDYEMEIFRGFERSLNE